MEIQPAPRWAWLLALLPLALGLLLVLPESRLQQSLRNQQFDQFQRWHPRPYTGVPVRIVDIDEASLQRLGQWPWPRTRLATLLDRLSAAGAAAVAFDAVFAEPDRTAPQAAAALWQLQGAQRAQLLALPDHDQVFARSLGQTPSVLGFALAQQPVQNIPPEPSAQPDPPLQKSRFVEVGRAPTRWLRRFDAAVSALPMLQQSARGNGALSFVPDADGVVRRVPLVLLLGDMPVASLVTETLRVAQGATNVLLDSAGADGGLAALRIGPLNLPTTTEGEMWLHYSTAQAARTLPAWQLLAQEGLAEGAQAGGALAAPAAAAQLAGAIVLVGSSAQGLMDLRFSPMGVLPGVEVHAQALEQVLGGQFLQRPAWARGLEAVLLALGGLLVSALTVRRRALVAAAASLGLLGALAAAAWGAFVAQGLLLDAVTPALGWLLCYGLCSLWQHRQRERQQRWIQQAFARYVSPNRVAYLLAHPQAMALGGQRQQCSFVFTDLANFTPLLEGMDPAQAVGLLNAYLDPMVAIAFRHEGTLDRIVGDALAIMFSAPVAQSDHAQRALACALEMDAFASAYAAGLQQQGTAFGQTRIGVHSGEVIVGNFGGRTLFDYRALGDPVNTAARLERANKQLGTRICMSQAIRAANPQQAVRPVGLLLLQGKSQALAVFEPVTPQDAKRAPLPAYLAAYTALQQDDAQALALFQALAHSFPHDPLVQLHCARLQAGERGECMVMRDK